MMFLQVLKIFSMFRKKLLVEIILETSFICFYLKKLCEIISQSDSKVFNRLQFTKIHVYFKN